MRSIQAGVDTAAGVMEEEGTTILEEVVEEVDNTIIIENILLKLHIILVRQVPRPRLHSQLQYKGVVMESWTQYMMH